jgi:hypothetical protein
MKEFHEKTRLQQVAQSAKDAEEELVEVAEA